MAKLYFSVRSNSALYFHTVLSRDNSDSFQQSLNLQIMQYCYMKHHILSRLKFRTYYITVNKKWIS